MTSKLLLFLLFILPFVVLPFGKSFFETPKVFIAEFVICILFILSTAFVSRLTKKVNKYIAISLVVFLLLLLIHLFIHSSPLLLYGNIFRFQGTLLIILLILFAFSRQNTSYIISPYFYIGILILQILFAILYGTTLDGRSYGTIGEPNSLAGFAIFVWPFAFFAPTMQKKLFLKALTLIFTLILIFLSGSRSGVIAFVLQLFYLFLTQAFHLSRVKSVIICIMLLISTFILPQITKEGVYENRQEIWQTALKAGEMHLLIGGGFGNTEILIKEAAYSLNNNIRFQYVDSSHNIFLDWFVQGGIVGLVVLVTLLIASLSVFLQRNMQMHLILLLGILSIMSFNPVSIVILLSFWWLVGEGLYATAS